MIWHRYSPSLLVTLFACGAVGGGTGTESRCALDASFNASLGTGFEGTVEELVEQSDGKILVAGSFTTLNGVAREGLLRLEATGAVDTTFSATFDDSVHAVAVDSSGSIYAGGAFTSIAGVSRPRLAKLDTTGAIDASHSAALGTGPNALVSSLALDGSGRMVVGGEFTAIAGSSANHLARIAATGAPDAAFHGAFAPGCNLGVDAILPVAGDGLLVGGSFSTCKGGAPARLFKVESDGDAVAGFNASLGSGFDNAVRAIVARSGGGYLVGGAFATLNTLPASYLTALLDDGTLDNDFNALKPQRVNGKVRALAVQANGKLLVGGEFSGGLARLEETGEEDATFAADCSTGFDAPVSVVLPLASGALLVGGDFNSFRGTPAGGLALLR